ncbi:MAG: glycosyltransferase family 4 protein [Chloroflexota bacterium]
MPHSDLPKPHRVLYVVSRFPSLTTTFTTNEMAGIAAEGVDVFVAPIWKPLPDTKPHDVEKPFLSKIVSEELTSPQLWIGVLRGLLRRPQVLWVILTLVPDHLQSIYLFLKLLVALPKGIYLGWWCSQNGVDHIHAHFLTSPTTVALLASATSQIPYSYTAHAFDITSRDPKTVNGSVVEKCLRAALGVTISNYNRRYMLQRWPKIEKASLEVVYNGLDTSLFEPVKRAPSQESAADKQQAWRVLSVGRLTAKKGHDYLIKAVASLRSKGLDFRLDIFGDGELQAPLQALIDSLGDDCRQHIQLRGTLLQENLVNEYEQADMFALACVQVADGDIDGLPTVLIEALAMEVPTVSTDLSGIPEIVQDHVTGLCVPSGEVEPLADALLWMAQHPDEGKAMSRQGRQLVLERFDRRKNAAQLLALWRNLPDPSTQMAK